MSPLEMHVDLTKRAFDKMKTERNWLIGIIFLEAVCLVILSLFVFGVI